MRIAAENWIFTALRSMKSIEIWLGSCGQRLRCVSKCIIDYLRAITSRYACCFPHHVFKNNGTVNRRMIEPNLSMRRTFFSSTFTLISITTSDRSMYVSIIHTPKIALSSFLIESVRQEGQIIKFFLISVMNVWLNPAIVDIFDSQYTYE